jgi:hypothetical protein
MNAQAGTTPFAFWLLPCAADADRLTTVIRSLAQAHGTPVFDPHVTLHVGDCPAATDIDRILARIAQTQAPLALEALATGYSGAYYKALFVDLSCELRDGPSLVALRRTLVRELVDACDDARAGTDRGGPTASAAPSAVSDALASYPFHPHVSLLYGEPGAGVGAELALQHDLQGHILRFDRIAAVRPATGHRDLSRVSHWEVYGHRRLQD